MKENDRNVRVRVAGLLLDEEKILLISHKKAGDVYWLLPGGGVDFGESLEEALIREFHEELNITIEVGNLAIVCDSIDPHGDRHILNIVFYCYYNKGRYRVGNEERLLGYEFFNKDKLKNIKLFPPINYELISLINGDKIDVYIGKMWLGK